MGLAVASWEGAILGVDVGHPIVTNGDLLHSYVKVHEAIELLSVTVGWVGPGIGVVDGSPHLPIGRRCIGVFLVHCLNGFS